MSGRAGAAGALCFCFPIVNHKKERREGRKEGAAHGQFFPPDSSFEHYRVPLALVMHDVDFQKDNNGANGTVAERSSQIPIA